MTGDICHIDQFITVVTSNERLGISNHRCLDCLFNSVLRLAKKEISKFRITGSLWGESTSQWWIPLTKSQFVIPKLVIAFTSFYSPEPSAAYITELDNGLSPVRRQAIF